MTRPPPPPFATSSTSSVVPDPEQLPGYLSTAAREALRHPGEHLVLAAVSAGQLLRAGAVRGFARTQVRAWLANLSVEQIEVLGEVAEQQLTESARSIHDFVSRTPSAQEMLQGEELIVDEGPIPPSNVVPFPPPAGWLGDCIRPRDRAESLLVALGIVALDSAETAQQELAASYEQAIRLQAQAIDETAQTIGVLLGDEVAGWERDAWFDRMATLEPEHWWMGLSFPRAARPRVTRQPTSSRTVAAARPPALVLPLQRKSRSGDVRLAAHGPERAPVSSPNARRVQQDSLWLAVHRVDDPGSDGDFWIELWLTDSSPLDLSGGVVRLRDAQGQPVTPLRHGPEARCWWGEFRGVGHFSLEVDGLSDSIPFEVTEG